MASPNTTYDVTPTVTFFVSVSTGSYQPGDIVDITTLGGGAAIDFTTADPGQTVATVVHNVDNTFSDPVFDYPSKEDLGRKDRDLSSCTT
jgi:hypothetical protein